MFLPLLQPLFIKFSSDLLRIVADWVPRKCALNQGKSWSCWHQCPFWLPPWMHWENGRDNSAMYLFAWRCWMHYLNQPFDVGWKWWDMGLDKIQSTVQLSPTCCHDRKENNLHAWWDWKVNKHRRANWETWKAYHNGCWVHYPHGPTMVLGGLLMVLFAFIYSMIMNTLFLYKFRSDPTENDSVEGLRPNARGPGLVTFGVWPYDYSVAVEFLIFAFSYYSIKCLLFVLVPF